MEQQPRVGPTPKPPHELAVALKADLSMVLVAALWAMRHKLPAMTLEIPITEMESFRKSLEYNEQKPKLVLTATHASLVVSMQDATTGNAIIQSESAEDDLKKKEAATKVRQYADSAQQLVSDHIGMTRRGMDSESIAGELHEALLALAAAAR